MLPSWYAIEGLQPSAWLSYDDHHVIELDDDEDEGNIDVDVRDETIRALAHVQHVDREILWLRTRGLSQEQVGERLGIHQCSVSSREISLHRWVRHVVPVRIAMRKHLGGELVPPHVADRDVELFRLLFWSHETQAAAARIVGLGPQNRARERWHTVLLHAPGPTKKILESVGRHHDWVRRGR